MQEIIKCNIAGFVVQTNCKTAYMKNLFREYMVSDEEEAEIDLCYTEEERAEIQKPGQSLAMFEYNYTIFYFVQNIVGRGAFCYHASALSVDGEGILFSADSGTGKSTHSRLWKEFMTEHEVVNLNDDKPIIRLSDGEPWVYGSPWSGKHSINSNSRAKAKALVFLERGTENHIEQVRPESVLSFLFPQVIYGKRDRNQVAELLELLDRFVRSISVYRLQCNISEEAVRLVYDTVWGN